MCKLKSASQQAADMRPLRRTLLEVSCVAPGKLCSFERVAHMLHHLATGPRLLLH